MAARPRPHSAELKVVSQGARGAPAASAAEGRQSAPPDGRSPAAGVLSAPSKGRTMTKGRWILAAVIVAVGGFSTRPGLRAAPPPPVARGTSPADEGPGAPTLAPPPPP